MKVKCKSWFRFSLRKLLVVMAMASIGLGIWGSKIRRHQKAVIAVSSWKPSTLLYEYEFDHSRGYYNPTAKPPEPNWIDHLFGEHARTKVMQIVSQKEVTDEELAPFRQLVELQYLAIRCNNITDDGLKHLSNLHNLKALVLNRCPHITPAGLKHLASLRSLEVLSVFGCPNINRSDLEQLQQQLPVCEMKTEDQENVIWRLPPDGSWTRRRSPVK